MEYRELYNILLQDDPAWLTAVEAVLYLYFLVMVFVFVFNVNKNKEMPIQKVPKVVKIFSFSIFMIAYISLGLEYSLVSLSLKKNYKTVEGYIENYTPFREHVHAESFTLNKVKFCLNKNSLSSSFNEVGWFYEGLKTKLSYTERSGCKKNILSIHVQDTIKIDRTCSLFFIGKVECSKRWAYKGIIYFIVIAIFLIVWARR